MDRGQEIELAASATVGSLNSLEGFDRTDMINMFSINYCPMCGRKLKGE